MPVLGSLARLATYNPDRRLLESSGALAGVLGSYNTERRMKAFGDDLIDAVESGKDLTQNDFLSLMHKHKLAPDEAEQTIKLIKQSGALESDIQARKTAKKPVKDILTRTEEGPRLAEGTSLRDLAALKEGMGQMGGVLYPGVEEPEYEQKIIYGPNHQSKIVPIKKGGDYTPPPGWSFSKPKKTQHEHLTIYGPKGQTMRVPIRKGQEYTPPPKWSLTKPEEEPTARAVKTWVGPDGDILHLPNNETPPPGYTPYSEAGKLEQRMNKRQELIILRQDKRTLKREISRIRMLPDLKLYQAQKQRLPLLEEELRDIEGRESELLGKPQDESKLLDLPKPSTSESVQSQSEFKTGDEVRAAYNAGKIDKDTALEILKTQFGME